MELSKVLLDLYDKVNKGGSGKVVIKVRKTVPFNGEYEFIDSNETIDHIQELVDAGKEVELVEEYYNGLYLSTNIFKLVNENEYQGE